MSDFVIATVLPATLNALVDSLMDQMAIDDPNEAVRRVNAGEWVVKADKVLHPKGTVTLPAFTDRFNPKAFYETRQGLFVWDDFRVRILAAAKPSGDVPRTTIGSYTLVKGANDKWICAGLPEGYVFEDAFVFCGHLAHMISKQANGEVGDLLANYSWVEFYVRGINNEVFDVRVRWYSGSREWSVNAVERSDIVLSDGSQVFSASLETRRAA